MSILATTSPFPVSSVTNSGDDSQPNVESLSDGGFLVSWTNFSETGSEVFAQRYSAPGSDGISAKVGRTFQVSSNAGLIGFDAEPSATALSDGGFLITWSGYNTTINGHEKEIFARRYGAVGDEGASAPVGPQFVVSSTTSGSDTQPSVTGLSDGGFLVSWTNEDLAGGGYEVLAQRYSAAGVSGQSEKVGGTFQVSSNTNARIGLEPSVTALSNGEFLVSWSSTNIEGGAYEILAQRYGAAGIDGTSALVGPLFVVNETTNASGTQPSVTALSDGGFLVSWANSDSATGISEVLAQRYGAAGTDGLSAKVGDVLRVSGVTNGSDGSPSVAALADGGFLVSWSSPGPASGTSEIYAQRYGGAGLNGASVKVGDIVQVSSSSSDLDQSPSVTALANGGFLVSWTGRAIASGNFEILSRQFGLVDALEPSTSGRAVTYMTGTSASETFTGDARNNYLNGAGGQDTAIGGQGDDTYVVDIPSDSVIENRGEGIDTIQSWASAYTLPAHAENLILKGKHQIGTGNELANRISGGKGEDVLNGRAGNDWLTGGAGSDTFVFERGTGKDVITDFVTSGSTHDVVDLTSFDYADFSQVQAALTQAGSDSLLSLSDGSQVTFLNHIASQFTAGDFLL